MRAKHRGHIPWVIAGSVLLPNNPRRSTADSTSTQSAPAAIRLHQLLGRIAGEIHAGIDDVHRREGVAIQVRHFDDIAGCRLGDAAQVFLARLKAKRISPF